MSRPIVEALIGRVQAHCTRHGIDQFVFIFHGGEPLLAGQEFYRDFAAIARSRLLPDIMPLFTLQTNGTLLTDEWCDLFGELGISIGISIDGPKEINDARRVDHAGRGSYDRIIQGIQLAMNHKNMSTPGILTVIDVEADPIATYEHHQTLGVQYVDFLLPDCTHDNPAPGLKQGGRTTPYADWLIAIFDRWFNERPVKLRIRMFEELIALILGASESIDTMGAGENAVLVIETDGGIEPIGSLKFCGEGFTKIGANVLSDDLDQALATDLAALYYRSGTDLPDVCRKCPIHEVCGGGYLPMRFSRERGFNNESVYCQDLLKLITHIQNAVVAELSETQRTALGIEALPYKRARRKVKAAVRASSLA